MFRFQSAVFDIPSELDEQLRNYWKDSPRIQMKPITELPPLDDASRNGNRGFSRSSNGPARGGNYNGNRNSQRSSKKDRLSLQFSFHFFIFSRCLF